MTIRICQRCKKKYKQPKTTNINEPGEVGCSDLYCFSCFVIVMEERINELTKEEKNK